MKTLVSSKLLPALTALIELGALAATVSRDPSREKVHGFFYHVGQCADAWRAVQTAESGLAHNLDAAGRVVASHIREFTLNVYFI